MGSNAWPALVELISMPLLRSLVAFGAHMSINMALLTELGGVRWPHGYRHGAPTWWLLEPMRLGPLRAFAWNKNLVDALLLCGIYSNISGERTQILVDRSNLARRGRSALPTDR